MQSIIFGREAAGFGGDCVRSTQEFAERRKFFEVSTTISQKMSKIAEFQGPRAQIFSGPRVSRAGVAASQPGAGASFLTF